MHVNQLCLRWLCSVSQEIQGLYAEQRQREHRARSTTTSATTTSRYEYEKHEKHEKHEGCDTVTDIMVKGEVTEAVAVESESEPAEDLLELYCGAANHTVALAQNFKRILCVELNKSLCEAANVNLNLNNIENVKVYHGHSENFAKTILRHKGCFVDKTVFPNVQYRFGAVLVDPPRYV